jgi:hypothetical protein
LFLSSAGATTSTQYTKLLLSVLLLLEFLFENIAVVSGRNPYIGNEGEAVLDTCLSIDDVQGRERYY